ncbi:anthranilate synthase component I family protein [Candidatus Micrarchaeota archaeon]|nr:anthranilate synthase component I family protein [Candidatus Micrarchaeota archaeon]
MLKTVGDMMITKKLKLNLNPYQMYSLINRKYSHSFLLESMEGDEKLARFSFIGFDPVKRISADGKTIIIDGSREETDDPIRALANNIPKREMEMEGFVGGAVGYFSHDYVHRIENIPENDKQSSNFPDFEFGIFDDCIVYDHRDRSVRYISHGKDRSVEILDLAKQDVFLGPFDTGAPKTNMDEETYKNAVILAKEKISNGEIFQVVLSRRYEFPYEGDLLRFYNILKQTNPSPYMYYLNFGERKIIGASPENLVRVEGKTIESSATLAGTMPRGKTPEEDRILEEKLKNDEKEKAEHLMLVDLTRNDVGKVCEFNSIKVADLMKVHKYSHVQHLGSLISGQLKEGKDCFDAFNALFPAGTLSGAPKVRAMEIIEELEIGKRGPYGGAVGYFSFNGNCDFAIAIRTLFAHRQNAYVQAGAGIVYDSVPEKEFQETENKMRAIMNALGVHS